MLVTVSARAVRAGSAILNRQVARSGLVTMVEVTCRMTMIRPLGNASVASFLTNVPFAVKAPQAVTTGG